MIESRLLAHHEIDQRRVNAVFVAARSYQPIQPAMARRVTQARIRGRLLQLSDCDLADHTLDVRTVNEGLHLAQAISDTIRALPDDVSVNLRTAFEDDPRYFA